MAWLAAAHGHVELLRWALDHGLDDLWNPAVCRDKAAATGHAEVLEFLVGERGVPLHSSIMTSAGWGGAVAVLEWGKAKGLAVKPAAATGAGALGAELVLGIVGAVIPAWRCLRLPIPEALKTTI